MYRRRALLPFMLILLLFLAMGCKGDRPTPTPAPLVLVSDAFAQGAPIPVKYTCDGEDVSPHLTWTGIPGGTQSLALIMDDPDAPMGTFVHWVLFDIPAQRTTLPEGVPPQPEVPGIGRQGHNDFGRNVLGYRGPCPPPGKPHRYFFRLYALNTTLNLQPGSSAKEVREAMKGHILGYGEYMGTYARKK